ncbi:hypothetical protein IGI04_006936 [Brassica rapa subsp. trilocularis]|uniref:YTH domain-containing family protein n=1 Tax=Brassica rapa subsp. trilocularis TaxID=1813537 RepID=A0ABQ7NIB1_BRACM|nr:hypothetical protein IGI04_006936 [Brassica rapa subsp. trilocularis]
MKYMKKRENTYHPKSTDQYSSSCRKIQVGQPRAKWGISRGSVSIDLQCESKPCPGLCKLKRMEIILLKHEARSLLRHIVNDVPNGVLKHITLQKNEDKPVTNSRDTQEEHTSKICILNDFSFYEVRQKTILEKKAKQHQTHKQVSEENSTEDEKRNLKLLIRLIRNLLQLLKLPVMSRLIRMNLFLNQLMWVENGC